MWTQFLCSALLIEGLPKSLQPKPDDGSPQYFELLEKNTHIVYPVLAVLVLVMLMAGILQAWKTQDLDGLQRAELKREIILELRKDAFGASVEVLSRRMKLDPLKLVGLLEQLQKDGVVMSTTDTKRLTTWRLKGVGGPGRY
jgi:hypothetical protein